MRAGRIILLNGASSAGKSTLVARATHARRVRAHGRAAARGAVRSPVIQTPGSGGGTLELDGCRDRAVRRIRRHRVRMEPQGHAEDAVLRRGRQVHGAMLTGCPWRRSKSIR